MKKKEKVELIIPFVGLKEGMHQYEFEIDSTFFDQFDYSIIKDADFQVKVDFEKKSTLFNLHFDLKGTMQLECDRCNDPISYQSEGEEDLIVKFGEEKFNETDEIKIISSSDYELDLTKEVYEYIHLLLPNKIVHEALSDCNQEVIKKLNEINQREESSNIDPRWSSLEKLKDNKN